MGPVAPVRFTSELFPVLAEAARELREQAGEENVRITGDVVRLHREGSGAGEISVVGTVDGDETERIHRVWFQLTGEDYDTAAQAHTAQSRIVAIGDLTRSGNRLRLANIQSIERIEE